MLARPALRILAGTLTSACLAAPPELVRVPPGGFDPAELAAAREPERARTRGVPGAITMDYAYGAVTRFSLGDGAAGVITLTDTFDVAANGYSPSSGYATVPSGTGGLPVLPTPISGGGRLSVSNVWSGAGAPPNDGTARSVISSAQGAPFAGVTNETAGGNSSHKIRLFTSVAQPPGGLFLGFNYNFVRRNAGGGTGTLTNIGQRVRFGPGSAVNARNVHDLYITAPTTVGSSEMVNASSGSILSRLYWTVDPFLSPPTNSAYFYISPAPVELCVVCTPGNIVPGTQPARIGGDFFGGGPWVLVPINQWFRVIRETTIDGVTIVKYDPTMSGPSGEIVIGVVPSYITPSVYMDRLAGNSSFEGLNDASYYDNLVQSGIEWVTPLPPPLACSSGAYADDLGWLNNGPLFGQSTRWIDALTSKATVRDRGDAVWGSVKSIRQVNQFPNDATREEFRTTLPASYAAAQPWTLCVDVTIPTSESAPNGTPHNLSPQSVSDGVATTRMFIGYSSRTEPFTPRVAIQTDPAFSPIDDTNSIDPFQPGPQGNGGNYTPGVNAALTGFDWPSTPGTSPADRRTVCFTVDNARNLAVTVNGASIYTGAAFVNSVDRLAFENKNAIAGAGNRWEVGLLNLACETLPLVALPPLALVYSDGLEWANLGITIGANRATTNPLEIFRWASAPDTPVVQGFGAGNTSKVLRISNTLRDLTPVAPSNPIYHQNLGTDARTILPEVVASNTRGWVARADLALTDDLSSRDFQIGETTPAGIASFYLVADLAFSSVTKTFWVRQPLVPLPAASPYTTFVNTGATLASVGVTLNQWFNLSIQRTLAGNYLFRINGRLLRDTSGAPVVGLQLETRDSGSAVAPKNLNAWFTASTDDNSAPANGSSRLYIDNIRSWALPCLGDANNDGVVDFTDLNIVLGNFSQSTPNGDIPGNVAPDRNGDGIPDDAVVNFIDLNAVLAGFGQPCA